MAEVIEELLEATGEWFEEVELELAFEEWFEAIAERFEAAGKLFEEVDMAFEE